MNILNLDKTFRPVAVQDFTDFKSPHLGRWVPCDGFRLASIESARESGLIITAQRRTGEGQYELLAKLA